jgi:hypothetical protein
MMTPHPFLECIEPVDVEGHEKREPELHFKEPKMVGSPRS